MKKVMKQVPKKGETVVIDLGPKPEAKAEEPKAEEPVTKAEEVKAEEVKAEEPVAEEPKAEEAKAEEPIAEEAEKHVCDEACDHAEEPAPKRSRKKQAEPSDAE